MSCRNRRNRPSVRSDSNEFLLAKSVIMKVRNLLIIVLPAECLSSSIPLERRRLFANQPSSLPLPLFGYNYLVGLAFESSLGNHMKCLEHRHTSISYIKARCTYIGHTMQHMLCISTALSHSMCYCPQWFLVFQETM